MKKFLIFFGLPIAAVSIFFSGSFPNTLIYDEESLRKLKFSGDEPISTEVVECEIKDPANLSVGMVMDTTFQVTLRNHTDRYVVISAIGEVFDPEGRSNGMHSQMFVLSPNGVEETTFRSGTPYTSRGRYKCEMRYAIGRFKY